MNEIAVNFGQLQATQEQVAATGRAIDQQLADLSSYRSTESGNRARWA